ncbi:TATA-binding protein-associated factor mot1 [Sorochytrium milnesiophthora]
MATAHPATAPSSTTQSHDAPAAAPTRLDRLVLLLDNAATMTLRQAAATQIAQMANTSTLNTLLHRVRPLLRSPSWDTRTAAGYALEAVAKNVPQWDPPDVPLPSSSSSAAAGRRSSDADIRAADADGLMRFATFDIIKVIKNGTPLLASSASDYDTIDLSADGDQLVNQRRALLKRLGMDADQGRDIVDDADLTGALHGRQRSQTSVPHVVTTQRPRLTTAPQLPLQVTAAAAAAATAATAATATAATATATALSAADDAGLEGMSARERNRLKRKMKMAAKNGRPLQSPNPANETAHDDLPAPETPASEQPPNKRSRITPKSPTTELSHAPIAVKMEVNAPSPSPTTEEHVKNEEATQPPEAVVVQFKGKAPSEPPERPDGIMEHWPFQDICSSLTLDLFHPKWECRHGAAVGLREIIKVHGAGAGKVVGQSRRGNALAHQRLLEDVSIRLLCVFALDRFGDYVGDTVVAPVRETCAQTLATVLTFVDAAHVIKIQDCLLRLLEYAYKGVRGKQLWEAKHACLQGLKYVMAVRKDMVARLLPLAYAAIVRGIQDHDDDVRAVSSSTLLPITHQLVQIIPGQLTTLVSVLWDALLNLDDLTASTATVMDLLATLSSHAEVCAIMIEPSASSSATPTPASATVALPLAKYVSRLHPFFRHTLSSVRTATLRVVSAFLRASIASTAFPTPQTWWITHDLIRHVFQNFLLEERTDIVHDTSSTWRLLLEYLSKFGAIRPHFQPILTYLVPLTMSAIGVPLDTQLMLGVFNSESAQLPSGGRAAATVDSTTGRPRGRKPSVINGGARSKSPATAPALAVSGDADGKELNMDAAMIRQDLSLVGFDDIMRGRVAASTALGLVWQLWPNDSIGTVSDTTMQYLESNCALHKELMAIVLEEYFAPGTGAANASTHESAFSERVCATMLGYIEEPAHRTYTELTAVWQGLSADCRKLSQQARDAGLATDPFPPPGETLTLELAEEMASDHVGKLLSGAPAPLAELLGERQQRIVASVAYFTTTKRILDTRVCAAFACALISHGQLPAKVNPIVRSIMASIKQEEIVELQERAAVSSARLLQLCHQRSPAGAGTAAATVVADKLVRNLCILLCSNPRTTPLMSANTASEGIMSMRYLDQSDPASSANSEKRRGRKPKTDVSAETTDALEGYTIPEQLETAAEHQISVRGATASLREMSRLLGKEVFIYAPKLRECVFGPLQQLHDGHISLQLMDSYQSVIDALQIVDTVASFASTDVTDHCFADALPLILTAVRDEYAVVRDMAARAIASMATSSTIVTMRFLIEHIIPLLSDPHSLTKRQGAAEVIFHVVRKLDAAILPYVIFMVVPLMGRMSDSNEPVRKVATYCFAALVKLIPLEEGIPDPPGFTAEMVQQKNEERRFLTQLLDPTKLEEYHLPVDIKAELRRYQQDGINWMMFLNRYQLHGILCDDMGLGKTLQTICTIASDHFDRSQKYAKQQLPEHAHCPSLVVCPSTLTGHWLHEILKYTDAIRPMTYVGSVHERERLASTFSKHDVVITSYEVLRNDIGELSRATWNYCVLDEGHIIRNSKTKITLAAKAIRANHRLILSGTPIQNSPLELWSLFDFLMPGFLGTEKQFNDRFGKPILASRDAKKSSREQEAGARALQSLHRQVLPFLLRRLKEDVLHDLPPKIIQDYYCDLSPVQTELYENFGQTQRESMQGALAVDSSDAKSRSTHVFQALQYLRKVCNHPRLVLSASHPQHAKLTKLAKNDLTDAPKLLAVKQILNDCGIGLTQELTGKSALVDSPLESQHRVLIFCQLKSMLDIIEHDLLRVHMPSVTFMRLDGSTNPDSRHAIVTKFNDDPSIDVLLLTTHVGGLGLNLTGADTVVFVEHDWNPMKDLQAMDRAHRLGQKKVVNVYRLITRGTLEEKIMGLQRFKVNIANQVVNQQNAGLATMDTDQVLDLFSLSAAAAPPPSSGTGKSAAASSTKAALESVGQLWDEQQYDDEYNLDDFIGSLAK